MKHGNPVTTINGLIFGGLTYEFSSPIRVNFPTGVKNGRDMDTIDWKVGEFSITYDYQTKKTSFRIPLMPVWSRSLMSGNLISLKMNLNFKFLFF